jgi:PAS domain S-box-containing protein
MSQLGVHGGGTAGETEAPALTLQVGPGIAEDLAGDVTLREVARLAVPALADRCEIHVVDGDGALREVAGAGAEPAAGRPAAADDDAAAALAHTIAAGKPALSSGGRSLIVPLSARGQTIGALALRSLRAPRLYGDRDLRLAARIAERAGRAVEQALLQAEADRAFAQLEAFFAAAPVGLALLDADLRCVRVNDAVASMAGLPAEAWTGHALEELFGEQGAQVEREILGPVLATGEPARQRQVTWRSPVTGEDQDLRISVMPVRARDGRVLGVGAVIVDETESRRALERERAARRRAGLLAHAGEILEGSLEHHETLANVARIAVPELADWCVVRLLDEDGELELVAVAHVDPDRQRYAWELEERFPLPMKAPFGAPRVLRTGTPEVIAPITDALIERYVAEPSLRAILRELGLTASVTVPLRARSRVIGTLQLATAESGRRFEPEDVELAVELGRRAALAVENARLYGAQRGIARALQARLLPGRLPEIPGVTLAARYRPAGEHLDVGGDFYDVYPRADGAWACVVGDVAGKGADAASLTALARHTIRAAARYPGTPAAILDQLNDALIAQYHGTEFCTVCLARYIPGPRREFRVALGGHPPALLLRADGTVETVGRPGTLLGVYEQPRLQTEAVEARPGDTLLLYTDGILESGSAERQLCLDGLRDFVASLAGRSAQEIIDAVEREAIERADGRPRDDIALLAVQLDRS